MHQPLFLFDLDGTLTQREILPEIAVSLGLEEEMRLLTNLTLEGVLNFAQSLRLRFAILRSLHLAAIQEVVAAIPLEPSLENFIKKHRKYCAVATGNVDAWIVPLRERLGCTFYCTTSTYDQTAELPALCHILDKGELALQLKEERTLVAIGDSDNDIPMLKEADISIAYGAAHTPVSQVVLLADHAPCSADEVITLMKDVLLRANRGVQD